MYLTVVIWMICFGDIAFGVTVTFEPSKAAMSDSVTITCERSSGSSSSIAWELDSSPLTSCDGTINDACIPSPTGYTFSTDVSANEFNLSLASTSITDCKTYTCTDATTTTDTESKKLYLGYWDKTEVTSTEPGANTDGSISITTGCVLSPDDLTITWTKIENGNSVDKIALSTSPVPSTDRSTCTRTCHTEEDQKVTSGFTHTEFTGTESETFQYMVTVSHSSYPDNADVYTWTSANYTQKKAPTEEIYDCPGLGNSTYVDSDGECTCAWLGICLCSTILTLICFGLILGYILIKYAKHYCCDECCEEFLECCFCCCCCSACCFIATLSAWYQILWMSVVLTPVAIGIWVVLKCLKIIEPDEPVITKKFSPNATSICVEWMKSNDGGSQILFYRITILRVTVKGNTEIEEVVEVKKINNILSTSCTFTELSPGTTYKVKVWAHNVMFRSLPGQEVIHTKNGKSDKDDTSRDVESTRSSPKHANSKLLNEKKQNSATGKAEGVNKGKHVSDTQIQDKDKSQKVHSEKNFRPQPQPPPGANINHSQLPNIPGHDKKGRGLSANFGDDDHPLVAIDIPAQKAGALPTITDTPRENKKKTKKKKKDKE